MKKKTKGKAGRPKIFKDGAAVIMIYLRQDQDKALRKRAKSQERSLSSVCREALDLLLKRAA